MADLSLRHVRNNAENLARIKLKLVCCSPIITANISNIAVESQNHSEETIR